MGETMKKIICSICAREGSKGVKKKNLKLLLGKPLIAYSVIAAKEANIFSHIAVSSDSDEILQVAKEYGADILIKRPDHLAQDESPKMGVIKHCFLESEKTTGETFDYVVDLDATSPLRNSRDIIECVNLLIHSDCENVITAMPARRSPYFNMVELDENGVAQLSKKFPKPIFRRQDCPKCYDMNASIYAWKRESLLNNESVFLKDTRLHVMPEERSYDIDTPVDFKIVELLMKEKSHE